MYFAVSHGRDCSCLWSDDVFRVPRRGTWDGAASFRFCSSRMPSAARVCKVFTGTKSGRGCTGRRADSHRGSFSAYVKLRRRLVTALRQARGNRRRRESRSPPTAFHNPKRVIVERHPQFSGLGLYVNVAHGSSTLGDYSRVITDARRARTLPRVDKASIWIAGYSGVCRSQSARWFEQPATRLVRRFLPSG
jgi:hypothetical protein